MRKFIGRQIELSRLSALAEKKTASFVVIKGRRRVGKSRLVDEFSKQFDSYLSFIGLPPEENVTKQDQLNHFCRQFAQQCKLPYAQYNDWGDVFWALGERIKNNKTLILFDEISWMGSKDPAFLGHIKNLWDLHFNKNSKLIFIVCGSASSWINKNLLSSTGFVGRISYTLTLEELHLDESSQFWPKNVSEFEKLKLLSVTGGIPKYLEEIDTKISAEDNIKRFCFTPGGFLTTEFNQIFSDLFLTDSIFYQKIIATLGKGSKERKEICEALHIDPNGKISEYLKELELAGSIKRDFSWHLTTGKDSKLSKYRLSDNYLRFYLNYIEPQLSKINRNLYSFKALNLLPEWNIIMGLQFENLILNNHLKLIQKLQIDSNDIINANPYFQRQNNRQKGCQIDYMIQTRHGTLYICEIKFSKNKVDNSTINEVQQKIDRLHVKRGMSFRPVLIHVNGVEDSVIEADYFAKIIDAKDFLKRK